MAIFNFGKIFFTGLLISFLGSLPLGTLNVAAMQISMSDGVTQAMLFAAGSLTAEIVYVRLSLVAMDWIRKQNRLFRILEWITLLIVVALAVSSFYAAAHPKVHKNVILSSTLGRYWLGLVMSALNPVQIPFWFGWSTVLFTKKVLLPRPDYYNTYILGIGLGTFIGNCLFIFGGQLVTGILNRKEHMLSWIIGGIFTVTALIQLWRMIRKKDVNYQIGHPEEVVTDAMEEKIETITSKTPHPH